MKTTAYIIAAFLLFLLLGVWLTYIANRLIAPSRTTAGDTGHNFQTNVETTAETAAADSEQSRRAWPASGELFTQDDLHRLPADISDLLADPGWNQPYITPSFATAEITGADSSNERRSGPYAVDVLVNAPLDAGGAKYQLVPQQDETGSYVDVAVHAKAGTNASGLLPRVVACVWAFRDGTVQFVDEGGTPKMLNITHRYSLENSPQNIYIIRLMLVDSEGGRSFADSLPIEIVVE